MNAQATVPAVREPHSLKEVAFANHGLGAHLVPQSMADVVRFAETMARGAIAIRKHLRDNPGACLAVTLQALDWGMNPISVANKSYAVNDQLAYESQLIAAVIHARAPIKGRPRYTYSGNAGSTRTCTVEVTTTEGEVLSYTSPQVGKITTKNSPLWKSDEDQQLGYFSIRSLARRHFPELLLGVYDREEALAMRDVTPQPTGTGMRARLEARAAGSAGFNPDHVATEIGVGAQDAEFSDASAAADHDADADTREIIESHLPAEDDTAEEDLFPGDKPAPAAAAADDFDPKSWARDVMDRMDEAFPSSAHVDAFFKDKEATRRFRQLEAESPTTAKQLEAALRGRAKALRAKEAQV